MNSSCSGRTTRREWLAASAAIALAALGGHAAARGGPDVRDWPAGRPAPPVELTDLDGKAWSLAALKGRPVLLNFWATWCQPCRAEMPSLELLASRHESAGLAVLAINYQETVATIRRFLETLPMSLPILLDTDGAVTGAWTRRLFPTTVLVDRSGTPRRAVIGELDWMGADAGALVEPLLARPAMKT